MGPLGGDESPRALTRRFGGLAEVREEVATNILAGSLWVPLPDGAPRPRPRTPVEVHLVLPDGRVLDGIHGTVTCIAPGGVALALEDLSPDILAMLVEDPDAGRSVPVASASASPSDAGAVSASPEAASSVRESPWSGPDPVEITRPSPAAVVSPPVDPLDAPTWGPSTSAGVGPAWSAPREEPAPTVPADLSPPVVPSPPPPFPPPPSVGPDAGAEASGAADFPVLRRPAELDPVPAVVPASPFAWEEPPEPTWEVGLPVVKEAPEPLAVRFAGALDLKLVYDIDISAGRLTVRTTERPAIGTSEKVVLVLPADAGKVAVSGIVTRHLSDGIQVTLDPLEPSADAALANAIHTAHPAPADPAEVPAAPAKPAVPALPQAVPNAAGRYELLLPFTTLADFKREYDANLRKGGVLVPAKALPPLRAPVDVVVSLMHGKREVRLKGECVFHTPGGAGVQLAEIPASTKVEIDALLAAAVVAPTPAASQPILVTPPPPSLPSSAEDAAAPVAAMPRTDAPAQPTARAAAPTRASADLSPAGEPFEGELVEVLREAEVEGEARVEGQVGGRASWLKVLAHLQAIRATGVLSAERKAETKLFLVYQGRLVDAMGKPPRHDETIFAVCRKLQLLKPGPLRILEKAFDDAKGADEFAATESSGVFSPPEHDRARRWQLNERASDVFAWERGRYRFDPSGDRSWARPTSGVSAGQIILHGVRSFIRASGEDLARILRPAMDRAITIVPASGFEPGKAGMNDKEIRFWADIDGKKTFRVLLQTSPLPMSQAHRLVFALARLGVLAFTGPVAPRSKEDPAEQLKARLADLRGRSDPFARLGLSWMASAPQIKAAFDEARRQYEDVARGGPPLGPVAKDILLVLEGAYREIADERARRVVRLKIVGDPARIEASAEMLAEKADILHLRGDSAGAASTLQMAVDLDPGNEAVKKAAAKLNAR